MGQLKIDIKKTIEYGQNFGVKYTGGEIKERLISNKVYSDKKIELKLKEINWPDIKKNNSNLLKQKIAIARNLGGLLANRFPDILLVGITGSVAAEYPKENEDIDLMIITKKNSLWITRLAVKIWTIVSKIPQRKTGKKQNKNEFCFNLWLEEGSLKLPNNRQNLRNAMDLILMKPVVNKNFIYEKFLKSNKWAERYVATRYNRINPARSSKAGPPSLDKEGRARFNLVSVINWLAFWLQYVYMMGKITDETIDIKRAYFHPKHKRC